MRLLVVIDRVSDIGAVADYVARRFDREAIEVGILALMEPVPAARGDVESAVLLKEVADLLGRVWNVRSVTSYGQEERSVAAVTRVSKACGAEVVLLEASGYQRLTGALFVNQLVRRLLSECRCAVELVRSKVAEPRGALTVTVPIQAERIQEFPLESLRRLTWLAGTRIRLVGLLPPLVERTRLEANDGAILLARSRLAIRQIQAESDLQRLATRLHEEFGERYPAEYVTTSASVSEIARQTRAAGHILLLADEARPVTRLARFLASLLPAWQTLVARCSIVLVSPMCPGRRPASAWHSGSASIEPAAK